MLFLDEMNLTLEDLHDLESRVMLSAEKAVHDVERFTSILSHVENLAKALINLGNTGCLLFNKWSAKLRYCSSFHAGLIIFLLYKNFADYVL